MYWYACMNIGEYQHIITIWHDMTQHDEIQTALCNIFHSPCAKQNDNSHQKPFGALPRLQPRYFLESYIFQFHHILHYRRQKITHMSSHVFTDAWWTWSIARAELAFKSFIASFRLGFPWASSSLMDTPHWWTLNSSQLNTLFWSWLFYFPPPGTLEIAWLEIATQIWKWKWNKFEKS